MVPSRGTRLSAARNRRAVSSNPLVRDTLLQGMLSADSRRLELVETISRRSCVTIPNTWRGNVYRVCIQLYMQDQEAGKTPHPTHTKADRPTTHAGETRTQAVCPAPHAECACDPVRV